LGEQAVDCIKDQIILFNKVVHEVQTRDSNAIRRNQSISEAEYSRTKAKTLDWLLFNIESIREEVLNNVTTGTGIWSDMYYNFLDLDSSVERFALQNDYHLVILNETRTAVLLLQPAEYELYRLVYLERMKHNDIAALIQVGTKTVERRVSDIRDDVFESLQKAGIELCNIITMKIKYKNIRQNP
jgi:predicted DNA-binding protein (UPF0251 family)